MNYLAHALACLDDPYQVAGAAVPDWLGLTRPRLRCRSRQAAPLVDACDSAIAAIARGVVRHHADDGWFHDSTAFCELSAELARLVRAATGDMDGIRPSFLGHILVELLIDASLIADDPSAADAYYSALEAVEPWRVAGAVTTMTGVDATPLASIIERFTAMRFLYDYVDDRALVYRLNQVMRRVRLPELPAEFAGVLPEARRLVTARRDELLDAPAIDAPGVLSLLAS